MTCLTSAFLEAPLNEPVVDSLGLSYPLHCIDQIASLESSEVKHVSAMRKGFLFQMLPRAVQLLSEDPDPPSFLKEVGQPHFGDGGVQSVFPLDSFYNAMSHHPNHLVLECDS